MKLTNPLVLFYYPLFESIHYENPQARTEDLEISNIRKEAVH